MAKKIKVQIFRFFNGPNGFYYDPVGNEIFKASKIGKENGIPVYMVEFSDEIKYGIIKDHGLHVRLA